MNMAVPGPCAPRKAASAWPACAAPPTSETSLDLARYVARPALAYERVSYDEGNGRVTLQLKTPWRDGTTHLRMTPLEFMQRLAALAPRPRLHLTRFGVRITSLREVMRPPAVRAHGVLAPNARLRPLVVPVGPPAPRAPVTGDPTETEPERPRSSYMHWARLLGRVVKLDLELCPNCGGKLRIIAAIVEREVIERILEHLKLGLDMPSVAA